MGKKIAWSEAYLKQLKVQQLIKEIGRGSSTVSM